LIFNITKNLFLIIVLFIAIIKLKTIAIGNQEQELINRLKINLFTPVRQLAESKLILAAPSSPAKLGPVLRSPPTGGAGVNEEPKRSGARRSQNQKIFIHDSE